MQIDQFLLKSYKDLGYQIINIPFGTLEERTNFIVNSLSCDL